MQEKVESTIGLVNNVKGSASFTCNQTTVICTVDIDNRNEQSKTEDYQRVVYDIRYKDGSKKAYDKYYTNIINRILDEFVIHIDICKTYHIGLFVDSLSNNSLFCSINALFLGLVNAGIPLKSPFYASTLLTESADTFVFGKDDEIIFYHGFSEMLTFNKIKVCQYKKYVKEVQDFTLKKQLLIKNI